MARADRYRRLAKRSSRYASSGGPSRSRVSGRRRPRRSARRLRLPCPGRAAPASGRGRARDLRRSRSARAPCARPRWGCLAERTSRFGPMRPTELTAASVWQNDARVREQFAPLLLLGGQVHADGDARLVLGVGREHERRHDQAEDEQRDDASVTARWPASTRCAAARALARPPRIATKNTPSREDPEERRSEDHAGAGRYRLRRRRRSRRSDAR